jgi:hypothetical protein
MCWLMLTGCERGRGGLAAWVRVGSNPAHGRTAQTTLAARVIDKR